MTAKNMIIFITGLVIGLLFWLLSPCILGKYEPWDYSLCLYFVIISIAGFILGYFSNKYYWTGITGLYIGQSLIALIRPQPSHETIHVLAGLIAMALYNLPSFVSGYIGYTLNRVLHKKHRVHDVYGNEVKTPHPIDSN